MQLLVTLVSFQFVEREARIACNSVISVQAFKSEEIKTRRPGARTKSFRTETDEVEESNRSGTISCLFCKDQNNHHFSECKRFKEIPLADKRAFIIAKRLCWGCLK